MVTGQPTGGCQEESQPPRDKMCWQRNCDSCLGDRMPKAVCLKYRKLCAVNRKFRINCCHTCGLWNAKRMKRKGPFCKFLPQRTWTQPTIEKWKIMNEDGSNTSSKASNAEFFFFSFRLLVSIDVSLSVREIYLHFNMLIHFFAAVIFFLNRFHCSIQHLHLLRNQICHIYAPFVSKVFVFYLILIEVFQFNSLCRWNHL